MMLHKTSQSVSKNISGDWCLLTAQYGQVSVFQAYPGRVVNVIMITGSQANSHKSGMFQKNVKSVKHCSDRQIEGREPC